MSRFFKVIYGSTCQGFLRLQNNIDIDIIALRVSGFCPALRNPSSEAEGIWLFLKTGALEDLAQFGGI